MPDATPPPAPTKDPIADLTALVREVATNVNAITNEVATLNLNVDGLIGDVRSLYGRVGSMEQRVGALETRSNSDRVRAIVKDTTSNADLSVQAQLGAEIAAREALAKEVKSIDGKVDAVDGKVAALDAKVDSGLTILGRIDGAISNPTVKKTAVTVARVIHVAGTAFLAYATLRGWR